MTVKDLIEILQAFPQDLPVVNDLGLIQTEDIRIKSEYYNGDYANPYCEVIDKVLYIE